MSRYKVKINAISSIESSIIEKSIKDFISKWGIEWRDYGGYTGIALKGKGFIEDILALDHTVDAGIFMDDSEMFIANTSLIFGNCLKKLLNFQWCKFKISSYYQLGLWHSSTELLLPIEAMVANKLSTLSELYFCFTDLFFQILCSAGSWLWPYGTHPLLDIIKDPEEYSESGEYWGRWSVSFPDDIKKRLFLLLWHDEERCLREAGLEVYRWRNNPDWNQIRCVIDILEKEYDNIFTRSWREEALKGFAEFRGDNLIS